MRRSAAATSASPQFLRVIGMDHDDASAGGAARSSAAMKSGVDALRQHDGQARVDAHAAHVRNRLETVRAGRPAGGRSSDERIAAAQDHFVTLESARIDCECGCQPPRVPACCSPYGNSRRKQ